MADRADVLVVGAGVSGLTTAVRLQEEGLRVRIVAAAPPERSTSNLAGAIWFPTKVAPRDRVLQWGWRTYDVLSALATVPDSGILMRECIVLSRWPQDTPWWADAVGGVRPALAAELPVGYDFGWRFKVPLAEMPVYLPWLLNRFLRAGGDLELRTVESLSACLAKVRIVVNCSGLGARKLVPDLSVVPVRGQLVIVTNPGLGMSIRDDEHPEGRAYVHPRRTDCVLGGTDEQGIWDTAVDQEAADSILKRCRQLAPALRDSQVLGHVVGLRPARPEVRVERDEETPAGRMLLHNYGHGGAGITVSWGCADEVDALIRQWEA